MHGSRAGSVQLCQNDGLEGAKHQPSALHGQRQTVSEQHRAHVSVGVEAIAVTEVRVVVLPIGAAADQLLEEPLDIVEERILELVDEQSQGRVHGRDKRDPVANVAATHHVGDPPGDVEQLDPPLRGDAQTDSGRQRRCRDDGRGAVNGVCHLRTCSPIAHEAAGLGGVLMNRATDLGSRE